MREKYIVEVNGFANYANERLLNEQKDTKFERKITSIAKKYGKSFEEVFWDWQSARMSNIK